MDQRLKGLAADGESRRLEVRYRIRSFDPGSFGARFFCGAFGCGHATMQLAVSVSENGNALATGEVNALVRYEGWARNVHSVLADYAVDGVEELLEKKP